MFILLFTLFLIQNLQSSAFMDEDTSKALTPLSILDTAVKIADGEIPVNNIPGLTMTGDGYIKSFTYSDPSSKNISHMKVTQTQFYINDILTMLRRMSMPIEESQLQYFLDLRCQVIPSSYQKQKFMDGVIKTYKENNLTDSAD